jgi:hypothetical protein
VPDYTSPVGSALSSLGDSLMQMLLYREEQKRKKFLDDIAAKDRESLMADRAKSRELQQTNIDALNESRATNQATALANVLAPNQELDEGSAGTLRKGGMGALIVPGQPQYAGMEGDDASEPVMRESGAKFRGTGKQIKEREERERLEKYLGTLDPESPEARALNYQLHTGQNPPNGMFDRKPSQAGAIAEYEYYVDQTTKAGKTPMSFEAYQNADANRKRVNPVVIAGAAGGPRLVDRGTGTSQPIMGDDGPLGPAPTADMRNRSYASGRARPVLDALGELSEKINTGAGLLAKITGEAEKLAAKANYDDDVAEYNALISGWTPLVARAVGHTGVLTEQDVQSVREMFPKPGDSKTLRDRKIKRLMSLFDAISGDPMAPGPGAAAPAAAPAAPAKNNDPLGIR